MVFTRYLHDLSPEHQQIWNAKRLNGSYKLHPDYYRNAIVGAWGTKLSLFQAFLEELKHINAMAKLIGKPALFRNEFEERPRGFSFLVRPTTKEFNDFVLLLDQTMSDNLNKDFFRGDIDLESETTRPDGKIVIAQKGTIQLLEQWFQKKMRFSDPQPFNDMLAIFREVRKARQHPAHTAEDSIFDQKIFKDQRELAVRAYDAVRTIRLMLANHPAVRDYKVPEKLFKGEIWTY
jgi:phenylalanyl-tRNA synthetase alpha subunit